jgi:hypothetical protein
MSKQKPDGPAPAEAPIFPVELRQQIASRKHWNERELEALCFGIPPAAYSDMSVADSEREAVRKAIREACNNGKLHAEKTGNGNAVYGGQWRIERVSAIRWAIGNGAYFPEWLARHDLKEIYARQDAERRAAGRYTLAEAAAWLAQHAGEREQVILGKLERAAKEHKLKTYGPGENATREYGEGTGQSRGVKTYYEEVCWDDLNAWLDTNEPRINLRFPDPAPEKPLDIGVYAGGNTWADREYDERIGEAMHQTTQKDNAPADTTQGEPHVSKSTEVEKVRGIGKREILAIDWPLSGSFDSNSLESALGDVPQWLMHARVAKGARGKGRGSALWNPAMIAVCLADKGYARPQALKRIIAAHFPEWANELEQKQEFK